MYNNFISQNEEKSRYQGTSNEKNSAVSRKVENVENFQNKQYT